MMVPPAVTMGPAVMMVLAVMMGPAVMMGLAPDDGTRRCQRAESIHIQPQRHA